MSPDSLSRLAVRTGGLPRRSAPRIAAPLSVLALLTVSPGASAQGSAHGAPRARDTLAVELRLGAIAADVVPALRAGDSLYLAPRDVLRLLGCDTGNAPATPTALPDIVRLVGASIAVDWSALTVTIADSGTAPAARRARRASAPSGDVRSTTGAEPRHDRSAAGPVVVRYTVSATADAAAGSLSITRDLGPAVASVLLHTTRAARPHVSFSRRSGASVHAVAVTTTNADESVLTYSRTSLALAELPVSLGTGSAGSDVEVFEGSVPLRTDESDGRDAPRVLLTPGTHAIRIVRYADGRRQQEQRVVSIPGGLRAPGDRELHLAVRCHRRSCRPDASFTFGLTARASLGVETSAGRADRTALGAVATARLTDLVAAAGVVGPRAVAGSLIVVPTTERSLRLDIARGDGAPHPNSPAVTPLGAYGWHISALAVLSGRRGSILLAGNAGRRRAASLQATTARGSTIATFRLGYAESGSRSPGATGSISVAIAPFSQRWLRARYSGAPGTLLSLRLGSAAGTVQHEVGLALPFRGGAATAAVVRDHGAPTRITLSIRRHAGAADIVATASDLRRDGRAVATSVSGALVADPNTRRIAAADAGGALSHVLGTVFVDDNGNGRYDGGERALEGVAVRAGGAAVVTDSAGRYDLPYAPGTMALVIEVDPLTLPPGVQRPAPLTVLPARDVPTRRDIAVGT